MGEKESKERVGKWNELMMEALLVFTTRGIKALPRPTYISEMQPLWWNSICPQGLVFPLLIPFYIIPIENKFRAVTEKKYLTGYFKKIIDIFTFKAQSARFTEE